MLDSLYTKAVRKRDSLNDHAEDIFDKTLDIDSRWIPENVPASDNVHVLAAGDGSFNKKRFLGFNFYAVAAESLIYNPHKKDTRLQTIESIGLDILPHQSFFDDRIRNMMSIFEIKTAIKTFNDYDVDYYMDDGSLLGDLIRPIPIDDDVPRVLKADILKRIQEKLEEDISTEISSMDFRKEFGELFDDDVNEKGLIAFLESIEHLIAMKQLLHNNKKIIAISKTSTSNDIFHANVPDMAIFDKFTNDEGYSKPYYKKVTNEVKRDFPIANNQFREMWFTIFFVRLEKNKNIIKVELPYHALEEDVRKIIAIIKSNATDGYPYLLKKAHNDVVIRHKDIENLSQIIEFTDKSGREMLD